MGYENIDDGDIIYIPSNLIEAGADVDTGDNTEVAPVAAPNKSGSHFMEMLMRCKKSDVHLYSARASYDMANHEGLVSDLQ